MKFNYTNENFNFITTPLSFFNGGRVFFLRGRRKLRKFFFLIVTKLSEIKIFQFFVKRFLIFNVGIDDFESITIDYDDDNDDKWNSKKKKRFNYVQVNWNRFEVIFKKKKIFWRRSKKVFARTHARAFSSVKGHILKFFFSYRSHGDSQNFILQRFNEQKIFLEWIIMLSKII